MNCCGLLYQCERQISGVGVTKPFFLHLINIIFNKGRRSLALVTSFKIDMNVIQMI